MRHALPVLAVLALGCEPWWGWYTVRYSQVRPDSESRTLMDGEFLGPGFSWDCFYVLGLEALESDSEGDLLLTYVGVNPGAMLGLEIERMYVVFEVLLGRWSSDHTASGSGILTGMRIGARCPVPPESNQRINPGFSLTVEKLWLNDAYGERDVGLGGVSVGAGCVLSF